MRQVNTPETRYTKTVDGVHIAYQVFGEGPSDLVITFGPDIARRPGVGDTPSWRASSGVSHRSRGSSTSTLAETAARIAISMSPRSRPAWTTSKPSWTPRARTAPCSSASGRRHDMRAVRGLVPRPHVGVDPDEHPGSGASGPRLSMGLEPRRVGRERRLDRRGMGNARFHDEEWLRWLAPNHVMDDAPVNRFARSSARPRARFDDCAQCHASRRRRAGRPTPRSRFRHS